MEPDNVEQVNPEQQNTFLNRISPKEITKITSIIIPSIGFLIAALVALFTTDQFCNISYGLIVKAISILYSLWICLGIIHLLLIYFQLNATNSAKISMTISFVFIELIYFTIVGLAYFVYLMREENCFETNIFPTTLIFSFSLIGLSHIGHYFIQGFLLLLSFPVLVFYCLRNPNSFFANFGIDPEILRNLPTMHADADHCTNCAICSEDIKLGDDIFILKCPGRHYFHGGCIKQWLTFKVTCPMCRSENVL